VRRLATLAAQRPPYLVPVARVEQQPLHQRRRALCRRGGHLPRHLGLVAVGVGLHVAEQHRALLLARLQAAAAGWRPPEVGGLSAGSEPSPEQVT
jgi:hypothetical protein